VLGGGKAAQGFGTALGKDEVGLKGEQFFAVGGQRVADDWFLGGDGRPVGESADADHAVAAAEGKDDFGDGGGAANDAARFACGGCRLGRRLACATEQTTQTRAKHAC